MLSFTCAMPCGVFLTWLACWLLSWRFTFLFRAAGLSAGCLRFYASLLPGGGSWFLRLAWRYGRCFWRRPFPYTWCIPDSGAMCLSLPFSAGSPSLRFLFGSPGTPVLLVSYASRVVPWVLGSLSSCPPSEGGSLVLQIVAWGSRSSAGLLASCFSLFARFRPGLGLVLAALGYSMFGCSVALLPGASAESFAFVMLT